MSFVHCQWQPGSFIVVCDKVGLGKPLEETLFTPWHFLPSPLLGLLVRILLMVCLRSIQCQGAQHTTHSASCSAATCV